MVRHSGKAELLHRVVYCQVNGIAIGQIKGLVVRHACDNARCIEPSHLLLGTQADNVRDMMERGRQRYTPFVRLIGPNNPNAKLNYEKAKAIRAARANGAKHKELAQAFGVSEALISLVLSGKSWNPYIEEINARLAPIALTADGLAGLGFKHVAVDKAAKLYREADFPLICDALVAHVNAARDTAPMAA